MKKLISIILAAALFTSALSARKVQVEEDYEYQPSEAGVGLFLSLLGPALEIRYRPANSRLQIDLGFGKIGGSLFSDNFLNYEYDDYDGDDSENQDDVQDSYSFKSIYYPNIYLGYNFCEVDNKRQCSIGATGIFLFTDDCNVNGYFSSAILATLKASYNFNGKLRFNYSTSLPLVVFNNSEGDNSSYFVGEVIFSQPFATGMMLFFFSTIGLTYYF